MSDTQQAQELAHQAGRELERASAVAFLRHPDWPIFTDRTMTRYAAMIADMLERGSHEVGGSPVDTPEWGAGRSRRPRPD